MIQSAQITHPSVEEQTDAFSEIPEEARIATRQGDPRPTAYWAVWNTCASENRAETARINGGRAAGFFLLDDLIERPGIQLGDHPITTCEEGLALLQGYGVAEDESSDSIHSLAAQLFAAELNLNAGAESCPIAEEAVTGGHLVMAEVGFDSTDTYASPLSEEIRNAIPRLVELLAAYNRGDLCR